MRVFLAVFALLNFAGGGLIIASAQSAIHEIEAFMLFLIGSVLLVGSATVDAIKVACKKLEAATSGRHVH
jgi:hypothetical protein